MAKTAKIVIVNALQFYLFNELKSKANDKGIIDGPTARNGFKNNVLNALVRHGAIVEAGYQKQHYKVAPNTEVQEKAAPKSRTTREERQDQGQVAA